MNTETDLPAVGGTDKERKAFRNFLRNTDTMMAGSGFINKVRMHERVGADPLYFVRVGLISGTTADENEERRPVYMNADLLVGSTLRHWAEQMVSAQADLSRLRCRMQIRNFIAVPDLHEGKPVLDTRGVLETIQFGFIEE